MGRRSSRAGSIQQAVGFWLIPSCFPGGMVAFPQAQHCCCSGGEAWPSPVSLECFARTGSGEISWKWTKGSAEGGHGRRRRRVGRCRAGEGGQHLPTVPAGKTTFSMLLTHSWEAAPGPSCHILLCHRVPAPGWMQKEQKCHCWTHDTPVLQSDSVLELWPHHHCALQAKDHYFFQQKGGNIFGRALILNGFCLTLLRAGSSHLETSTSRAGTDIQQREVLIPQDPGIHHQVPDILHPHQSPPHPGS